jgi:chromosome segregation protein
MKLAKLELSGFKSFADYTEFNFDDGITGIVGPNGCGKSNVVDAVKWVLGEMSAKSLRGDGMMDVIFNGSGTRKPMGMAEVSLTFTNEDRRLPIDAERVKITRRLYRDTTSEYLINAKMARLKDIRELFLDTGIGVDAYSLIEQGRVAALIDSNAQDRREIFEEAAGISRFKARKKETLKKLEKTDQNMAQVTLVVEEVEKQLRSVKVQAGRARNYQEYANRLRELRSAYVLREYEQLAGRKNTLSEQLADVTDELANARRKLDETRTRQQEVQLELDAAQEQARTTERDVLNTRNESVGATQRRDFATQQITQMTQQQELLTQRLGDLTQRMTHQQAEATQLQTQYEGVDAELKRHEAVVQEASAKQEQAAKQIAAMNRTLDENKSKAIEIMRRTGRINSDISGLKITQESYANQRQRLQVRKEQLDQQVKELKAKVKELEARRTELETQSATHKAKSEELRTQQQANSSRQVQMSRELSTVREQRSGLLSRRSVLLDLQNKREGLSQATRDVIKQREAGKGFAYVTGLVADVFTTDVAHAPLIEAALGDAQNAVLVAQAQQLVDDRKSLAQLAGRLQVLCLDQLPAFSDGYDWQTHGKPVVRAVDVVRFDSRYAPLAYHLLGRTLIVETLQDALELAHAGARGYRFVARTGEVLEADAGMVQVGDASRRGGFISRRSELTQLETELAQVEEHVAAFTAQIAQCDQAARQLDAQIQEVRQQIYQADSARAEVNAQCQQAQAQQQRTQAEAPMLGSEMESLARQIEQCQTRQAEGQAQLAGLETEQKNVEAAIHEIGSQVILRQHEVSELSEAATQARIAMTKVQEQRSSLARALAMSRQAVEQSKLEWQRVQQDAESLTGRIREAHESVAKADAQIAQLTQVAAQLATALETATEVLQRLRQESVTLNAGLTAVQQQHDTHSRREHELSLQVNELNVRLETLISGVQQELGINLVEAITDYQPAEMDWDAVAEEIGDLRGKISRLGNVNLDAITEQSSLEERQQFLHAQLADITQAKQELETLIGKINEDSKVRFIETFNAVREHFQDMFRKLFGGGKADLVLENPDDVLESGIEVLARPPGKELQSISLLSGGEKTMTAVAMVMSIFKSKPSPFCILDEVDAALDEANTARFASIVQEFLHQSQFIVITHNKRTMSVTDVLYGVTMQEQGVSKRVAVKFDPKGTPVLGSTESGKETAAA